MKHVIIFSLLIASVLAPRGIFAQGTPHALGNRVNETIQNNVIKNVSLVAQDAYGTPIAIKLARQGKVKALFEAAQIAPNADFLNVQDKYGNNLFHVAKNADTVQTIASLIRRFYGAKAPQKIASMVDKRNLLGETPLHAQINAGHIDTFRPLYAYTTLKKKNDIARKQLARLQGSDMTIFNQNKAIYCQEIRKFASSNGRTLLQTAQDQIPYNPDMAPLAQRIGRILPCLAQN